MRYQLSTATHAPCTAIRVGTELNLAEVEQQAQHLRSWALIRGAKIADHAFVRLLGEGETCVVELPASAVIVPDKETGLTVDTTPESPAIVVSDVSFEALRGVVRALRQEFGSECGRLGAERRRGRVVTSPASMPAELEVEDLEPVAVGAVLEASPEPALAGRRFGLHWRRWRRQDS